VEEGWGSRYGQYGDESCSAGESIQKKCFPIGFLPVSIVAAIADRNVQVVAGKVPAQNSDHDQHGMESQTDCPPKEQMNDRNGPDASISAARRGDKCFEHDAIGTGSPGPKELGQRAAIGPQLITVPISYGQHMGGR
jgi:hypothetical protein